MEDMAYKIRSKFRELVFGEVPLLGIDKFAEPSSAKERLLEGSQSDFARVFLRHSGRATTKWVHYLDIYDKYLAPLRGTEVRFLEIGVYEGGSLEVLRKYLGRQATIFGIDVNPACANCVDAPNQCRIGSQTDPEFLRRVVKEMGGIDVVLDDGSHWASHQEISFSALFPLLPEGGLYMIEDMHTSYWPGINGGGLKRKGTAIELVKEMIDDMHRWYYSEKRPSHGPIGAIHTYDSLTVIEKKTSARPSYIRVSGT